MPLLILALSSHEAAVCYVTEFVTTPSRERRNLVTLAAQNGRMRVRHERELPRFSERALAPIVQRLARLMLRVNPRMSLESVAKKLAAAGMRRTTPTTFLAIRGFCGIAGLVLGLLVMSSAKAQTGMLSMLLFTVLGFFGPSYWLTLKARRRADLVASELPDALDLLAVSVEAGMGFDGEIAKLMQHMQGRRSGRGELAPAETPRSPGEPIAAAETLSSDPFEVEQLRAELSASLAREQELRTTLQVDTALDETMSQDVAAKLAELDHRASQLSETESALEEREQTIAQRFDELVETEARLNELQEELTRAEARATEREQLVELKVR